ncbi:zgc: Ras-like family member 11A-like [Crotalus adamanteus]|uniref:Zgc: Ras-like family member 11A-like n=1 Tax=Crotalus adamanteus TaxID=8729 RepID=A0AAW1C7Q8_CROAD
MGELRRGPRGLSAAVLGLNWIIGNCNREKQRGLHLVRPKSPNMQELKRRLKQALSLKGKTATLL